MLLKDENSMPQIKRKPYDRPLLQTYGDLGEVTAAAGTKSMNPDTGGMGMTTKTS
jgi:hypothetical protein